MRYITTSSGTEMLADNHDNVLAIRTDDSWVRTTSISTVRPLFTIIKIENHFINLQTGEQRSGIV